MTTNIHWIPALTYGRLAIMPRPMGWDRLEAEVKAWREAGIDVVVCLLTPREITQLGLQQEAVYCAEAGIRFVPYPIVDAGVPDSIEATLALIANIDTWLKAGENIAVHCHGGIGRSGLIASCALIAQGISPHAAMPRISIVRGIQVPETDEQRRWVEDFVNYWKH